MTLDSTSEPAVSDRSGSDEPPAETIGSGADIVATLDAASVQASVLDHLGTAAAVDFRARPWVPGQPNRSAMADRLILDTLIASVRRVSNTGTLAMLSRGQSGS